MKCVRRRQTTNVRLGSDADIGRHPANFNECLILAADFGASHDRDGRISAVQLEAERTAALQGAPHLPPRLALGLLVSVLTQIAAPPAAGRNVGAKGKRKVSREGRNLKALKRA